MIILVFAIVICLLCFLFYRWNAKCIIVHIHSYSKPIASRYICFNVRDIVYECRCGKRKIDRVYRNFGDAFPIPTNNFITRKELEEIANKNI